MQTRTLLFADLDGTFLEPRTYSFAASRRILPRLRAAGIPLIFSASKTRAEMGRIHEALGLRAPFLVENGGAVFIPRGAFPFDPPGAERRGIYDVIPFGATTGSLVAHLDEIESETSAPLVCFHRMTAGRSPRRWGLRSPRRPTRRCGSSMRPFVPPIPIPRCGRASRR